MISRAVIDYCKKNNIAFNAALGSAAEESILHNLNTYICESLFDYYVTDITDECKIHKSVPAHAIIKVGNGNAYVLNKQTPLDVDSDGYTKNIKKIFLIRRRLSMLTPRDFFDAVLKKIPSTGFWFVPMVLFSLLTPLYSSLFNTRLVYSDNIVSVIYITVFFVFFALSEFILRHWINDSLSIKNSVNTVELECYLVEILKKTSAKCISTRVKAIVSYAGMIWEHAPQVITDAAFMFVFFSCLMFLLGGYASILFAFYFFMIFIFISIRFRAYKNALQNVTMANESLSRILSIERNKKSVRHIKQDDFTSYYEAKVMRDEEEKRSQGIDNQRWAELLKMSNFLSTIAMFISSYLAVSNNVIQIGSIIAIMIVNSRLHASVTSLVNRVYITKLSRFSLLSAAEIVFEKLDHDAVKGVYFDYCDNITISKLTLQENQMTMMKEYSANFSKGDVIGVFGPSGSGKSTLIDTLAKNRQSKYGEVFFNGVSILDISDSFFKDHVSYHSSETSFYRGSLIDNARIFGLTNTKDILNIIKKCAPKMKFDHDMLHNVDADAIPFSSGEKQRVLLSLALWKRPLIVFMDESTSYLSATDSYLIIKEIKESHPDTIIFIASHEDSIRLLCNKIIDMGSLYSSNKKISIT